MTVQSNFKLKFEEIIIFLNFCLNCTRTRGFSHHTFPVHFVGFLFWYFYLFLNFLYTFMKMKAYAVCARAQASIFMVFRPFSQKKKSPKLLKKSERWPNQWSKLNTLEDKPRSGWSFFHKMCQKYYRKSCKYMGNNSTKENGKKISTSHYRSKFRAQRYGDTLPKTKESLEEKRAVHTSCKHSVRRICQ